MKYFIKLILIFTLFFANSAIASISLIRDAETEKFLRDVTYPIFRAADLKPQNIDLYIVNDNSINAFVMGGQNIFVHTGLIRKFKTPDSLIGVMAHEVGHIVGGHLARSSEDLKKAQTAAIISLLLGIGAAVAGSADAAQGIILGGNQTAQRLYLKYNRTQEEAADQYAIKFLEKMNYPATGLVNLLNVFDRQLIGYKGVIDEYLLSHPVSKKRISLIKERTKNRRFTNRILNSKLQKQMDYVNAKLEGFIDNPKYVIEKYKNSNNNISNYAKSIAYFRNGQIPKALETLEIMIKNLSHNKLQRGFAYELKGQILFESGKIQDSVLAYKKAIKLLENRNSSQAKIFFATSILSINNSDQDLAKLAVKSLNEAKTFEKNTPFLFKQLAIGYNKLNQKGKSLLAFAQYHMLINNKKKAKKYAKEAKEHLENKEDIILAEDILELIKVEEDK